VSAQPSKVHLLVDGPLIWRLSFASGGSIISRLSAVHVYLHVGRYYCALFNAHHRLSPCLFNNLGATFLRVSLIPFYCPESNMGQLPKEAIILIVIASAGASVLIAWAIHSIWHGQRGSSDEILVDNGEQAQAAYRQEVRIRNYEKIAAIHGFKYPSHRYDEV